MISTSILSIKDNIEENIQKLDNTKTTFMHIDVMDGIFVSNNSVSFDVYESLLKDVKTPLDVHLMVQDVKKYIDLYKGINPVIITFHYEAVTNHIEIIEYIKTMAMATKYISFMHFVGDLLVTVLLNIAIVSVFAFVFGKINVLLEKKEDNIYW